jgi:hypothetical protein
MFVLPGNRSLDIGVLFVAGAPALSDTIGLLAAGRRSRAGG